ncbi:helix-turn-helix transcriptional regulator, partial [Enterococcus hirae]|nr:helix-turn-helix transcriptional regulator [Enterococcus hirae]
LLINVIKRVSENIKSLRKEKKYSQEELAELSGLHRTYISQIERGVKNPTIKNLEKIACALDIDIIEFFKKEG